MGLHFGGYFLVLHFDICLFVDLMVPVAARNILKLVIFEGVYCWLQVPYPLQQCHVVLLDLSFVFPLPEHLCSRLWLAQSGCHVCDLFAPTLQILHFFTSDVADGSHVLLILAVLLLLEEGVLADCAWLENDCLHNKIKMVIVNSSVGRTQIIRMVQNQSGLF